MGNTRHLSRMRTKAFVKRAFLQIGITPAFQGADGGDSSRERPIRVKNIELLEEDAYNISGYHGLWRAVFHTEARKMCLPARREMRCTAGTWRFFGKNDW